jgi:hypothetical protein
MTTELIDVSGTDEFLQESIHKQSINQSDTKYSNPVPTVAHGCLIIPFVIALWWYYTKRSAQRVYNRLLLLPHEIPNNVNNTNIRYDDEYSHSNYLQHNGNADVNNDKRTSRIQHDNDVIGGIPTLTSIDLYRSWDDVVSERHCYDHEYPSSSTRYVRWLTIGKQHPKSRRHYRRRNSQNYKQPSRNEDIESFQAHQRTKQNPEIPVPLQRKVDAENQKNNSKRKNVDMLPTSLDPVSFCYLNQPCESFEVCMNNDDYPTPYDGSVSQIRQPLRHCALSLAAAIHGLKNYKIPIRYRVHVVIMSFL